MAVNTLATWVDTSAMVISARQKQPRLAPSVPPGERGPGRRRAPLAKQSPSNRPAPMVPPAPGMPPAPVEEMPAERSWLGAPRSIRLPHMTLPRVALPQVGMPHWSVKVPTLPVAELTELYEGAAQLITLWNGPNVEDIRRFEGDASKPYSYGWFQSMLTECALLHSTQSRLAFLEAFSVHGSPKLTDELAALEYFCMKTAYLPLQLGDRHRFCCGDYGWQTVTACIRDFNTGLVAHVLTPEAATDATSAGAPVSALGTDPSSPPQKPPVLVVFRGTSRVSNQPEAELSERPTGCQADLDWDGIGFHAFAANKDVLLTLVRKYMALGHPVVLAGHSLGGVFAARTMCALTPDEQRRARLRNFNASGLDPATRALAAAPENNIMVRHRDDKLPRAGGEMLPGTLIITVPQGEAEALYPHGMPLIAANALNGRPAKYNVKPTEPRDMSRTLEMGRKFLCLVAHDRVEI